MCGYVVFTPFFGAQGVMEPETQPEQETRRLQGLLTLVVTSGLWTAVCGCLPMPASAFPLAFFLQQHKT
jgi:hypothetical protein